MWKRDTKIAMDPVAQARAVYSATHVMGGNMQQCSPIHIAHEIPYIPNSILNTAQDQCANCLCNLSQVIEEFS